mgnify:FL=1
MSQPRETKRSTSPSARLEQLAAFAVNARPQLERDQEKAIARELIAIAAGLDRLCPQLAGDIDRFARSLQGQAMALDWRPFTDAGQDTLGDTLRDWASEIRERGLFGPAPAGVLIAVDFKGRTAVRQASAPRPFCQQPHDGGDAA